MFRASKLEAVEASLEAVRERLDFGIDTNEAELDAREAISELYRLRVLPRPGQTELLIAAEATLSVGRARRLRGEADASVAWLRQAEQLLTTGLDSRGSSMLVSRLAETLNLRTLIELNRRARDPRALDAARAALGTQRDLLASYDRIHRDADHYLDLLQRAGELLAFSGQPDSALRLLTRRDFDAVASGMPEHGRSLRLLFTARTATAAGAASTAASALEAAERLPVVDASPFVKIIFLESAAEFFASYGSESEYTAVWTEAQQLRRLEQIDEERRVSSSDEQTSD